jgi:hypothetical protein
MHQQASLLCGQGLTNNLPALAAVATGALDNIGSRLVASEGCQEATAVGAGSLQTHSFFFLVPG